MKASRWTLILGLVAAGCMTAQNHSVFESISDLVVGKSPYVEAYIEYPGPQEKWAGPTNFVLHVTARDPQNAQILAGPVWFNRKLKAPQGPQMAERGLASLRLAGEGAASQPASPAASPGATDAPKGLPTEIARQRLQLLANAMESGPEQKFAGCLSPVRVRLIRSDGALLEKTACRSDSGWPFVAAEAVNYFMSVAVYGAPPA